MALEFKKKETVRMAVERLVRRSVDNALQSLEQIHRLESVHEIRKCIKQSRALLRLVRTALPRSAYHRSSNGFRRAAGQLAGVRDAHIKVQALANLIGYFKGEVSSHPFRIIKRILISNCCAEQEQLTRNKARKRIGRLLRKVSRQMRSSRLKASGWAAIAPGLKRSYRKGRRDYQRAEEAGTPSQFHEWRKRVKDLQYQLGVLQPICPEQISAAELELKQLGECLGNDHDLFLLTEPRATQRFAEHAQEEAEVLKAMAAQRHRELRSEALKIGAGFYTEKPSTFTKRLGHSWRKWRREPSPHAST